MARRAEEFVQQELSAHVLDHSYRAYCFGKVLAASNRAAVDGEVVYRAALLHDLHLEHPTPGGCFAVTAGRVCLANRWAGLPTLIRAAPHQE